MSQSLTRRSDAHPRPDGRRIAFIGGGNMARSLIAGLIADGHAPTALTVSDADPDKGAQLAAAYGVRIAASNSAAAADAEVLVLCVKPQVAAPVCRGLADALGDPPPLVISVMAGVTEASISAWLGRPVPLVRTMPNTPVMVQSGAIGLHAAAGTTPAQMNLAEEILRAGGLTRWVEQESDLDLVTALSGSGPAYFFLFMEALEEAAAAQGMNPETARLLSIQTALGAARMAMESRDSPAELRARVTSPGGTTERAIATFEEAGLRALVGRAVEAARARAAELSTLFAEER
jgi:pyrroline-5-carboxylate reductase